MNRTPLTAAGAERLRTELHKLKTEDRPRIIKAIAEAREHGDLKENAEYHAAREQQSFAEGRIQELEGSLSSAQIIDPAKLPQDGRAVFGTTVTIADLEGKNERRYQIVGELEADIESGRISVTSPIARALIGKSEGDEVLVVAPGGEAEYEIVSVEYGGYGVAGDRMAAGNPIASSRAG